MRKDICLNCRHFHQSGIFGPCANVRVSCELGPGGECRLKPPVIPLGHDGKHDTWTAAIYPIVYASYWCGQHETASRAAVPAKASDRQEVCS